MGSQPQGGGVSTGGQSVGMPQPGLGIQQQGMPQTGNGYNAAANPAGFDPSMLGGLFQRQAMQPQINAALNLPGGQGPTGQGPDITNLVRGVGQMYQAGPGGQVGPAAGKGK